MTALEWNLAGLVESSLSGVSAPERWERALDSPRAQRALGLGDVRDAYVEVRTGHRPSARTDIITRVSSTRRASWAASLSQQDDPRWRSLRAFNDAWCDAQSSIAFIGELWFEYDDVAGNDAPPSCHFGLLGPHERTGKCTPDAVVRRRVRAGLAGLGIAEPFAEQFETRVASIEHGTLIYVGVMTSREPKSLKGYIMTTPSKLSALLTELGVGDTYPAWSEALATLRVEALSDAFTYVDVTLSEDAKLDVAIVFPQQHLSGRDDPTRAALLTRLVEQGWLSEPLLSPLQRWPDTYVVPTRSGFGQCVRRYLDLKLLGPEALTTKAYLGISSYHQLLFGHE
jgi:hypothetical protein